LNNKGYSLMEKEVQLHDRYKFGYQSPNGIYLQSKKYTTHAVYKRKETKINIYLILGAMIFITVLILMFGCIEQLIIFLFSIIFSTIVSSFLLKR